ncbi:MAG TPA: DUF5671 domain-containing protein [Candidatus Dormibacteraeota bacterium]
MILRRLYLYLVSIAALTVLAFGLALLGNTILLFVFDRLTTDSDRSALAGYTATVVVAFPVWVVHQWFARRFAMRDPGERASGIRHLYVYLACAASSIGAAVALAATITSASVAQLDGCCYDQLGTAQAGWVTAVLLVIWAFHFRIAARDHAAVTQTGASATLRRWYVYAALFVGLFMMLIGAQGVIQVLWIKAIHSTYQNYAPLSLSIGRLAAGLLLWAFHARVLATRYIEEDRKSTLRAVEGFIAVAVCIVAALVGASQILYYGVARALGIENPGGVGTDLLAGMAQPASYVIAYGIAWFLIRRRLTHDAAAGEAVRQAGIRRLYTNLVALVSMGAFGIGAAGLLGTLLELAEAPLIGVGTPSWKDPISLWITLMIVGAAVWLAHWRRVPWLEERVALSRRLYLWAVLLVSVLAILGGSIGMLYVVFQQVFSAQPRLSDSRNLSFGQSLAIVLVAAAIGIYHWRVMRSDALARHARITTPAPAVEAPPITAPIVPAEPIPVPEGPAGMHFELSVVGATEDDVHQALANLPPQASYKLTPADHST